MIRISIVLTPVYIMRLVRVKFSDTFVGYKHFELGESQITSATCTGIPESWWTVVHVGINSKNILICANYWHTNYSI